MADVDADRHGLWPPVIVNAAPSLCWRPASFAVNGPGGHYRDGMLTFARRVTSGAVEPRDDGRDDGLAQDTVATVSIA